MARSTKHPKRNERRRHRRMHRRRLQGSTPVVKYALRKSGDAGRRPSHCRLRASTSASSAAFSLAVHFRRRSTRAMISTSAKVTSRWSLRWPLQWTQFSEVPAVISTRGRPVAYDRNGAPSDQNAGRHQIGIGGRLQLEFAPRRMSVVPVASPTHTGRDWDHPRNAINTRRRASRLTSLPTRTRRPSPSSISIRSASVRSRLISGGDFVSNIGQANAHRRRGFGSIC